MSLEPAAVRDLIHGSADLPDTYLGTRTSDYGHQKHVGIKDDHRLMHTLCIGPTGHGKSQLMTHAALQDAAKDRGFAIIDPAGDIATQVLAKLPEDRLDDVVYLNPNLDRLPTVNVLDPQTSSAMTEAERDKQQQIVINELVGIFRRLSTDWGARWGRLLESLIRAHIRLNALETTDEPYTLMDLFTAVKDTEALQKIIDQIHDPVLANDLDELRGLSAKEKMPITRRIADFLGSSVVKRFITQPESDIDFQNLLDNRKILIVDLQKGSIGRTPAKLIGSIVLTKIWSTVQGRVAMPEHERTPFYLYVDELDNFTDDGQTFNTILSEARKYKLGCWLAGQFLNQLGDTDLRRAVTNNCRTKIFFNSSGSEDTHFITEMLTGIDRERVTTLSKFQAAVQQPATDGTPRNAVIFDTYPPWEMDYNTLQSRRDTIVEDYDTVTDRTYQITARKGSDGDNTGGERHAALLEAAYHYFQEDHGHMVTILDQQPGDDRPDGHIDMDGERVNLEAERSTLSRPGKVLRNVQRAAEQDRPVIFVVEAGDAQRLENILSDPVNRRGDDHSDDDGTFDYYTRDGEPFTNVEVVEETPWSIYEHRNDTLFEFETGADMECPELNHATEEELERACLYRDSSGYCEALEAPCCIIE